ncbi:MAG: nitrilase-related carbon-nitrogen hydrolase [Verrucomicrobiota bacterium]
MQIVACQYDILWEDREGNFNKVRQLLAGETIEKGALIVLPEMFSSGFSMNVDRIAEGDPSQAEAFLSELAKERESWVMGGLVFSQGNGRGRNELAVFGPDGDLVGRYQKNHCFTYTKEAFHYDPGDEILTFDWRGFTVCPTICYDLRFPELYRRGMKAGANLFVNMACWPEVRWEHWSTLLRARAMENQAIVVGCNRCGEDPTWDHAGRSVIIDEQGRVLAEAEKGETCVIYDVSLQQLLDWREEFQPLKDMKG